MASLEEVLEIFGGSLFPDDYRADLPAIQDYLAANTPVTEVYGEANASHDLLYSLYHSFCGNHNEAYRMVQGLLDHVELLPPRWRLRCISYKIFHLTLRRYPSIIRFRSENDSLSACMDDARFSGEEGLDLMSQAFQLQRDLSGQLHKLDLVETFLIVQFMRNNAILWKAMLLHPAHPEGSWSLPSFKNLTITGLDGDIPHFQKLTAVSIENAHHRLTVNIALRHVEVLSASDKADDARQLLLQVMEHSVQHGDKIGQALCKMLEADMIISPPFSNPIALNLIAMNGDSHNCDNRLWDHCEDTWVLRADPKADRLYCEASDLFESQGSNIGVAAVKLREAAILLGKVLNDDTPESVSYQLELDQIGESLEMIVNLCDDDAPITQLTNGHRTVLAILNGDNELADLLMTQIGTWGRHTGSECIADFIGFFVIRFGRRLWKDKGRVDIALRCCDCVQSLFTALPNSVALFQVITERAELHDELQNYVAARQAVLQSIEALDETLAEIDLRIANAKSNNMREILPGKRLMFLMSFNAFVGPILAKSKDVKDQENWEKRFSAWNETMNTHLSKPAESFADNSDMATMLKMFTSPKYHEKTTQTLWQDTGQVHAVARAYRDAQKQADEHLARFDVDKGIEALEAGCFQIESMNLSWDKKVTHCVLASYVSGNQVACSRYLSYIAEADDLKEIASRPVFASSAPWCRSRFDRRLRNQTDAENLLARCVMANEWERGARLLQNIEDASPGFLDPSGPDRAVDHWKRCRWAGLIAEHTDHLEIALKRYVLAEEQLVIRRSRSIGPDAKVSSLSSLAVVELYTALARLCLKASKAQLPITTLTSVFRQTLPIKTWEQAALLFIERGRAQSLLEFLSQNNVEGVHPGQISDITLIYKQRLRAYLETFSSTYDDESDGEDIKQELEELNEEIRSLSEKHVSAKPDNVIEPMSLAGDLYTCLDEDTLLIELAFSAHESVFVAATKSGVQFTSLPGLRRQQVRDPVYRVMKSINDYKTLCKDANANHAAEPASSDMTAMAARIATELGKISHMILEPITDLVKKHSHLVFSAGHPFVAFPFAALPFGGEPLFLSAAVSTTPSLAVYAKLSSQRNSFIPRIATVVKSGLSTKEEPLPLAAIESMVIANDFDTWPYKSNKLSNSKFGDILQSCTIMHIGTHGATDANSPWLSYISLKSKFRVIDLSNIRSKAALVVFAACQSGLAQAEGDEMLGFANAVLQTGTMAYLGSLWEVSDAASMILMIYFYRAIKQRPKDTPRSLAELWRQAMQNFYHTDNSVARRMIDGFIDDLDQCKKNGRNPDKLLRGASEELQMLKEEIDIDFKHPYFYASFALTGFGGLICEVPDSERWQQSTAREP